MHELGESVYISRPRIMDSLFPEIYSFSEIATDIREAAWGKLAVSVARTLPRQSHHDFVMEVLCHKPQA